MTIIFNEEPVLTHDVSVYRFVNDLLGFSALCACLFSCLAWYCQVRTHKLADNKFAETETTWGEIGGGIVKHLSMIVHPSDYFEFNSSLNEVMSAISYFRVLFIYSYLVKLTHYYGTRPGRLLSVYGHKAKSTSLKFAIKCLFKERGLLSNLFLLFFASVVLALIGMTLKQGTDLLNQIYLCVITMGTVGYGDETV